jgi:metal-responsive CopG/Arc/MetJ family transcriptional regulator
MKTAISIPDSIFKAAEKMAQRLGLSRSELYARAVAEYMEKHRNEEITKALNKIYKKVSSQLDPALQTIQYASIEKNEW